MSKPHIVSALVCPLANTSDLIGILTTIAEYPDYPDSLEMEFGDYVTSLTGNTPLHAIHQEIIIIPAFAG